MVITLADWKFRVDVDATMERTKQYSTDHCLCAYCRNFYESVDAAYPRLRPVLAGFGIYLDGPVEVMPFTPTLVLVCYRVQGEILRVGQSRLHMDTVPLIPESSGSDTFHLWVGPMELPWLQEEAADEVISPANEPEFLARMEAKWLELSESDTYPS